MTKHTILFLAADPNETDPRALGHEARSIQEELERSGHRDCFAFETRWATRPLDVLRELRRLRPAVVHFSGHGGQDGLSFEAVDGRARLVSAAALAETFGAIGASVRLVVLSACYSEAQAEALLAHVDCVAGMGGASGRDIARTYAIGFYGGLGEGEPIAAAHRQGCAAISLEGLCDRDRPRLKARDEVDTSGLILVARAAEWQISEPAPTAQLRLDRAEQRRSLDELPAPKNNLSAPGSEQLAHRIAGAFSTSGSYKRSLPTRIRARYLWIGSGIVMAVIGGAATLVAMHNSASVEGVVVIPSNGSAAASMPDATQPAAVDALVEPATPNTDKKNSQQPNRRAGDASSAGSQMPSIDKDDRGN